MTLRTSAPMSRSTTDSNGAILAACLSGKTADQLRHDGVPFTDSQIRLLLDWGLLTEERRVLKTRVLVLDEAATLRLRGLARERAAALASAIEVDVRGLIGELRASGREKNTYTVLLSYVLDNLTWERFYGHHQPAARGVPRQGPG